MSVIKESACTYYSPSVALYLMHHVSKHIWKSAGLKPKCVFFYPYQGCRNTRNENDESKLGTVCVFVNSVKAETDVWY